MSTKNFDEEYKPELTFTIGGEDFHVSYVRPEVLAGWGDEITGRETPPTEVEALAIMDGRIKGFLNSNGDAARWDEIRARDADPVTGAQMNGLLMWLIEVHSDRPTIPPSPSASGRGRTAASSKDA